MIELDLINSGGLTELQFCCDTDQPRIGEPILSAYGVCDERGAQPLGILAFLCGTESITVNPEQFFAVLGHQPLEFAQRCNAEPCKLRYKLLERALAIVVSARKYARHDAKDRIA